MGWERQNARLWHTAMLAKWKSVFEYIPIESQIEKFQNEYYEAIARCHVEGESTLFIEFMSNSKKQYNLKYSRYKNAELPYGVKYDSARRRYFV